MQRIGDIGGARPGATGRTRARGLAPRVALAAGLLLLVPGPLATAGSGGSGVQQRSYGTHTGQKLNVPPHFVARVPHLDRSGKSTASPPRVPTGQTSKTEHSRLAPLSGLSQSEHGNAAGTDTIPLLKSPTGRVTYQVGVDGGPHVVVLDGFLCPAAAPHDTGPGAVHPLPAQRLGWGAPNTAAKPVPPAAMSYTKGVPTTRGAAAGTAVAVAGSAPIAAAAVITRVPRGGDAAGAEFADFVRFLGRFASLALVLVALYVVRRMWRTARFSSA